MILVRSQIALILPTLVACQGTFEEHPPVGPCDGVVCSGHGRCFEDGDEAFCRCDDGYVEGGLECVLEGADGDGDSDSDTDADQDTCLPSCVNRECGANGCGGMCAPGCSPPDTCNVDTGQCECLPDCHERECGSDGCGRACPPGCGERQLCEDGRCTLRCEENLGWGNACSGVDICIDGSTCQHFPALSEYGFFCSPSCGSDDDCPGIAAGRERCVWGTCVIECASSDECPCEMECRDLMGAAGLCYP